MLNVTSIDQLFTKTGKLNSAILRREEFKTGELYQRILARTGFLPESASFLERLHCFYHGLTEVPRCEICGAAPKLFTSHSESKFGEYRPNCANRRCAAKVGAKKTRETNVDRYDAKVSPNTIAASRERADSFVKKSRKTLIERYGVENPSQLPDWQEKVVETLRARYGVSHPSQIPEVRERQAVGALNNLQALTDKVKILARGEPPDVKKELHARPCPLIKFSCNACGSIEELPYETFKWRAKQLSTPCTTCSGVRVGSALQHELASFIASLTDEKVIVNERNLIYPLELDVFIPARALAIEFNGIFWHSSAEEEPELKRNYHLNKLLKCREKGVRLIQVLESEWVLKGEIVKSRIRHLLGMSEKIFARKCVVVELTSAEKRAFLIENHIQGDCGSSVNYGLVHNGELVSVMTFARTRFSKALAEFELVRFANKLNTTVVGGASKLLNLFVKRFGRSIVSYSDNRWSDGKFYRALGFTLHHESAPNYWYWHPRDGLRLRSRLAFQKHRLAEKLESFDETRSEAENAFANGYRRIWDCGNSVWVLNSIK